MKPYFQDDAVQIFLGDCREILPQLPKVDLVLTDPPYGVNKAEWDVAYDYSALEFINTDKLGLMCGVWNVTNTAPTIAGLRYKWMIIAHLINGMTRGGIGFGNYIPCLIYLRDGVSIYEKSTDCLDVIVGAEPKPDHPSPKPESAITFFVERLSSQDDTILDPFMGSGTTLRAAKNLGRKAIGIEIEEKYCEIAAKRMAQQVMNMEGI